MEGIYYMTIPRFGLYLPCEIRHLIWKFTRPTSTIICENCKEDLLLLLSKKIAFLNSRWCLRDGALYMDEQIIPGTEPTSDAPTILLEGDSGVITQVTSFCDVVSHKESGICFKNKYETYLQSRPYFLISSNYLCIICHTLLKKKRSAFIMWKTTRSDF